jgi:hypothetical protein
MEKLEEPIDYESINWNKYFIKGINGNLYLVRYGRDYLAADEREICKHCRRKIKTEIMRSHVLTATCREFQERNERIKKYGRKKPGVKPRVSVPLLSQSSPQVDF